MCEFVKVFLHLRVRVKLYYIVVYSSIEAQTAVIAQRLLHHTMFSDVCRHSYILTMSGDMINISCHM